MKQGKTEKAVFAKLSTQKVELEEQKVDLLRNPIEEIIALEKEMRNLISDASTKSRTVIDDIKRLYNLLVDVNQVADKLEGKSENAIQAFVEMGGRPPQEVIRALDRAQRSKKGVVSGVKTAKTAIKNVQNITSKL